MNWISKDNKNGIQRFVLAKEVSYDKILTKCKEDIKFTEKDIQILEKHIDNKDTYRVYKQYLDYDQFLWEYICMYKIQDIRHEYVSERLWSKGRIVLDFDFKKDTSLYNQIKNLFGIDEKFQSKGLEGFIMNLICKAFVKLGCKDIAQELGKPVITWLIKGYYRDHLGVLRDMQDNIEASPFCFISDCRDGKLSYHVLLPIYSEQRHIHTLYLIETMNMLLREGDMGINLFSNESFSDINMAKEYQCIRLPGMYKYNSGTKLVVLDQEHFPYCVTSNVEAAAWVPDIWRIGDISCPSWIVDKSNNLEFKDIEDDIDKLWYRICSYEHCKCITDHYNGIEVRNKKYTLVPKETNNDEYYCPVCNANHSSFRPIISRIGNKHFLSCFNMNHKNTKKSIYIEDIDTDSDEKVDDNREQYIDHILTKWFGILDDIPNDIRMDKYEDKRCQPFPSPDKYKLLMVASPMGTGKTHQLRSWIQKETTISDNILIISFRKTLGMEIMKSIQNITYYEDEPEWMYSRQVVTTIESFWKWKYLGQKGYTVIIDEWESAMLEIIGSTVRDKRDVLSAFEMICKNASKIIAMDAKLTWNTGGTFFELLGISRDEMYVSWNTIKDNDIQERKITIHSDIDRFYTQLKNEHSDNRIDVRANIYANSIGNKIKYMRKLQDDEICVFTAKSTAKHIDVNDRYFGNGKIKVCISNSVDQAGVSFDRKYFDVQYSYGNGMTGGFDGLIQMERRVRNHSQKQTHAYVQNWRQNLNELNLNRFMTYIQSLDTIPYHKLSSDEKMWIGMPYRYKLILARLYVKRALSSHYYKEGYIYMHKVVHGYSVEIDSIGNEKKKILQEYKSAISNMEVEKVSISNSYDISIQSCKIELKELNEKISTCNDQDTINSLKQQQMNLQENIEKMESDKKDSISEIKDKLKELKQDMKQYINDYNEENGIEKIPVVKVQTPSWKEMIEQITIEETNDEKQDIKKVETQLDILCSKDIHPDLRKIFISDADELYYFNRCITRCNRTLKWKQAPILYYQLWCKNKKENVICVSMMKEVVTERDKKYNEFRSMGMTYLDSMNKACPHMSRKEATLGMIRFDRLVELIRLGTIIKHDDMEITVIYKYGTQNNPELRDLLFLINNTSNCWFKNSKGELCKDVWKRIDMFMTEFCCIDTEYKEIQYRKERCIQYRLLKETSLLDLNFLYTKILEVKDDT